MTSFIKFLLDPFNILWFMLLAVFVAWYLRKERQLKWLVIGAVAWFIIISTPLLPNILVNSLENRFSPIFVEELEHKEARYHIIVLGGGHGYDERLPANSLLSLTALGRLNEGIRLHRQLLNSKLVLSGFSASGRTSQAEMLQQTAILLGINEAATILQKEPGNTYEEARNYANNYGSKYPVILVTSAIHMPRAVMLFERFGVEVAASPANYRLRGSWKRKWIGLPSTGNIDNLRAAFYEYAAILKYRL